MYGDFWEPRWNSRKKNIPECFMCAQLHIPWHETMSSQMLAVCLIWGQFHGRFHCKCCNLFKVSKHTGFVFSLEGIFSALLFRTGHDLERINVPRESYFRTKSGIFSCFLIWMSFTNRVNRKCAWRINFAKKISRFVNGCHWMHSQMMTGKRMSRLWCHRNSFLQYWV